MTSPRFIPYLDAPTSVRTYRLALLFTLAACGGLLAGRMDGNTFALVIGAVGGLLVLSKGGTAAQYAAQRPGPAVGPVSDSTVTVEAQAP